MSAQDALAKARAWACENLTDSQAGKLCGMLSEVSRENAKLRELCKSMRCALADHEDKVYLAALDDTLVGEGFDLQKLGIEVNA